MVQKWLFTESVMHQSLNAGRPKLWAVWIAQKGSWRPFYGRLSAPKHTGKASRQVEVRVLPLVIHIQSCNAVRHTGYVLIHFVTFAMMPKSFPEVPHYCPRCSYLAFLHYHLDYFFLMACRTNTIYSRFPSSDEQACAKVSAHIGSGFQTTNPSSWQKCSWYPTTATTGLDDEYKMFWCQSLATSYAYEQYAP